jgi:hypothetical protein
MSAVLLCALSVFVSDSAEYDVYFWWLFGWSVLSVSSVWLGSHGVLCLLYPVCCAYCLCYGSFFSYVGYFVSNVSRGGGSSASGMSSVCLCPLCNLPMLSGVNV